MPARSALVVGSGVAGLATAFRLRRSCWDVVLLDHAELPSQRDRTIVLRGAGHAAARRLGLAPALAERAERTINGFPVLSRADLAAVMRAALNGVTIRRDVRATVLVPDDCGVTVTFSDGDDEWFDLVAGDVPSDVDGAVVRVGDGTTHDLSRVLYTAELLGDAFDIFPDAETSVRWWREQLRPCRTPLAQPPTWMPGRRSGSGSLVRTISRTTGAVSPRPRSR